MLEYCERWFKEPGSVYPDCHMLEQVDKNIVKLHYGEALKSKDLQGVVFSSLSAVFGNAFDITSATIHSSGWLRYIFEYVKILTFYPNKEPELSCCSMEGTKNRNK